MWPRLRRTSAERASPSPDWLRCSGKSRPACSSTPLPRQGKVPDVDCVRRPAPRQDVSSFASWTCLVSLETCRCVLSRCQPGTLSLAKRTATSPARHRWSSGTTLDVSSRRACLAHSGACLVICFLLFGEDCPLSARFCIEALETEPGTSRVGPLSLRSLQEGVTQSGPDPRNAILYEWMTMERETEGNPRHGEEQRGSQRKAEAEAAKPGREGGDRQVRLRASLRERGPGPPDGALIFLRGKWIWLT
nr:uncharacterized protein LOC131279386 [Dasypus novemcinctus]